MLTEVPAQFSRGRVSGNGNGDGNGNGYGDGAALREVARALDAAEQRRRVRSDATATVERMAVQARRNGAAHPVAAALASAARISRLAPLEEFAERTGIPTARLAEAEAGAVPFGELPRDYDAVFASIDVDLLSLADLEAQWRQQTPTQRRLF
jgi:hypothetical protein